LHYDVRAEVAEFALQFALYIRKQVEHCRGRGGSHGGGYQGRYRCSFAKQCRSRQDAEKHGTTLSFA
jgi:hypothetical protein